MILLDVNVLIYAFRQDAPDHALYKAWLTAVVSNRADFGLSPLTLAAVIRITTNARTFSAASTLEEAFRFCDYLRGQPNAQLVEPRERHWDIFKRLCIDAEIRGPRVTDAWYAALAIEWDCEWITTDRDFARFPGLKCRVPAAP